MKDLLSPIAGALKRGENAALALVIASQGSAPRKEGSVMAAFADGTMPGTVGGGALEFTAQKYLRNMLADLDSPASATIEYDLAGGDASELRMICGGDVTMHYLRLTPTDAAVFDRAREALDAGDNAILTFHIDENATELSIWRGADYAPILAEIKKANETGAARHFPVVFTRSGRVYIFGGGHIGQALVPVLSRIGFLCAVYDDRAEYARLERFPEAERAILGSFEEIARHVDVRPEDYAVIVTPAHRSDYEVCAQMLATDAKYVGCIGSRRKMAVIRERLRDEAGYGDEAIARLVSPIGIAIGAETPEEIAISIAAELIKVRAGIED